ncbi:MAG: hypothetical protein V1914_04250 [archaeon]
MDNGNCFQALIDIIDPTLEYKGLLGRGAHGIVIKVRKEKDILALKVNKIGKLSLEPEFMVQKSLSDIEGVPEAVHLYSKDAFLMELIGGELLYKVYNVKDDFFHKLRNIARQINERGYFVSPDMYEHNIMVGSDGNPWVIDFWGMDYTGVPVPQEVFDWSKRLIDGIERRYKL